MPDKQPVISRSLYRILPRMTRSGSLLAGSAHLPYTSTMNWCEDKAAAGSGDAGPSRDPLFVRAGNLAARNFTTPPHTFA